ncbi:B12-binding domain-containing radical SAM protein [Magnetospira sp. QH-2]|uniref:B12-binding domain-containing radical SAM protein n=1 Tax=Magnetospira sp. (strain QH-2) TaxID=1288970 RepID=UPI0003E818A2|nr:radical SAM protein [Magnetospira sp. QH-2]CCQ74387.1 putative methyltransferase [Magnetospira sp. QH-2]
MKKQVIRLGLIAVSGVRVQDQTLLSFGLTLPGFVERSKVIASLPSLSLLTLAGMAPQDIEVSYHELPNETSPDLINEDFDVVAIASYTARIKDAYRLSDLYRARDVKTIMGGLHVTALPDEAKRHADTIVLGEAETVWPRVLDDLKAGCLASVYDGRGEVFDLANAPMPRFDLLDPNQYNRLTVQTQRGCPYDCSFCASSVRLTPRYQVKPVDKVMAEIDAIKMLWPQPFIEFADDNSFVNKSHSKALLKALAKRQVRWFTESDLSIAEDEEMLALMQDSGCAQVLVGFESPTIDALSGLERKADWKARQVDRYAWSIDRIQRAGITVNGCFVLGMDGQGGNQFDAVEQFVKDSGLYEVQVTIQTPFPGTPLYDQLKADGRLINDTAWEKCSLFDLNYYPDGMTVEAFTKGFRDLVMRLYSEEATHERRRGFFKRRKELVPNGNSHAFV